MFNFKQYDIKQYNIFLLIIVFVLGTAGAYFVMMTSVENAASSNFKKQMAGLCIGLVGTVIVSFIDYHSICRFAALYYAAGVVMALLTNLPGTGTTLGTGSKRWLNTPGFKVQPSELCKVILILSLAVFFCHFEESMDRFRVVALAAALTLLQTIFIATQMDLSSSLVMVFIFVIMTYAAGLSYKIIAALLAVGIPSGIALIWYILQPFQILLSEYQQGRILSFFNQEEEALDGMFQQNHSYQGISSGQLLGKLFTEDTSGRIHKINSVTESDFIFSVIGEEVGFIGSCVIIGLLATIVIVCLVTARRAYDRLGMLIAIGVAAMFMFQTFANIGVATKLLPNTGLPLPFVSQGLSSLMGCMISIGLIINVGLQSRHRFGGFSMI